MTSENKIRHMKHIQEIISKSGRVVLLKDDEIPEKKRDHTLIGCRLDMGEIGKVTVTLTDCSEDGNVWRLEVIEESVGAATIDSIEISAAAIYPLYAMLYAIKNAKVIQ